WTAGSLRLSIVLLSCALACLSRGFGQPGSRGTILVNEFEASQFGWQQLEIAKKLVELKDRRVLSSIKPHLTDADRQVRGNAAFVFAGLGDPVGFQVI